MSVLNDVYLSYLYKSNFISLNVWNLNTKKNTFTYTMLFIVVFMILLDFIYHPYDNKINKYLVTINLKLLCFFKILYTDLRRLGKYIYFILQTPYNYWQWVIFQYIIKKNTKMIKHVIIQKIKSHFQNLKTYVYKNE